MIEILWALVATGLRQLAHRTNLLHGLCCIRQRLASPFPLPPYCAHLEPVPWIIQGGTHAEGPRHGLVCLYSCARFIRSPFFFQQHSLPPSRGPDGRFRPLQQVLPMDDSSIGGWNVSAPNSPVISSSPPPTPPPKDEGVNSSSSLPPPNVSSHLLQSGYPFVNVHRAVSSPVTVSVGDSRARGPSSSSFNDHQLSRLTAAERSKNLRKRRMNPYLQFMCGPLLRYDTVDEHGVWHGAALIVGELCKIF
jgi:hypothetical protein